MRGFAGLSSCLQTPPLERGAWEALVEFLLRFAFLVFFWSSFCSFFWSLFGCGRVFGPGVWPGRAGIYRGEEHSMSMPLLIACLLDGTPHCTKQQYRACRCQKACDGPAWTPRLYCAVCAMWPSTVNDTDNALLLTPQNGPPAGCNTWAHSVGLDARREHPAQASRMGTSRNGKGDVGRGRRLGRPNEALCHPTQCEIRPTRCSPCTLGSPAMAPRVGEEPESARERK